RENMPVNHVGFYDAARFANWLHNAQPTGAQDNTTTEDGAYTITAEGIASDSIVRNPEATVFVPSEDEWYKAAYFRGVLNRFYDYPSSRDEPMICEGPGGSATRNAAACGHPLTDYTDVGSFTRSYSPNSTYDQGGNIWEWNENNAVCGVGCRGLRGGDFGSDPGGLAAANADYRPVASESHQWGFRVAGLPDPIPPEFEASAILHTFGNDQVDGSGFPFDQKTFIARPLAARCNPANGGVSCGTATLQKGAPVVGSGTALLDTRVSPPGFDLPPAALKATATGSLPQFRPYQYISTYLSSQPNTNAQASFGQGFDYGKRSFLFPVYSGTKARVAINPGVNRFGGTMRILGTMGARRAHEYQNKTFVGTGRSIFGLRSPPCSITCYVIGGAAYFRYQQYQTSMGDATTPEVISVGFSWTTGTVSVTATEGPFPTRLRRSGYDNRTANGLGTIQMVTPRIVKWDFPNRSAPWDRYTGAIGILRLKFVPEPSGWVMMIAGVAFLSIGYKTRRVGWRG
ncbi:MAG: SUMF1/EgtB/PvdO family nonheme iron enzyme, partial [Deltaproteobacteria bacterium]|nr:SUMF1/EgtB/PvdO family nonheme iron enzyme [Deltaproteobacteria bacterium]